MPYYEPQFPTQPQNVRPPPEVVGKEEEIEVEGVIDTRKGRGGKIFYKVKWKGYGPHEMTWEPFTNLANAKVAVKEFHDKFPHRLRHLSLKKLEIPLTSFPRELF